MIAFMGVRISYSALLRKVSPDWCCPRPAAASELEEK